MPILLAILPALYEILGYLLRSVIIKFVVFFAIMLVVTAFVEFLTTSGLLPTSQTFSGALGGIPSGVAYFLSLFKLGYGMTVLVSSYTTRFIIRRIPVIG